MFERILSLFSAKPVTVILPGDDVAHALGALMVRAAKVDDAYLFEEVEKIDRVLAKRYNLNPVEAAKLRAACERLEREMPDTEELAQVIHMAIPDSEAEEIVRTLWQVVLADGIEHESEDNLLHEIERILGVAPERAKELHDEEVAAMGRT